MINRIIVTVGIFMLFFLPEQVFASTLYLSPGGGTIYTGGTTSVQIRLNTGGDVVNAVSAFLSYPADKLDVVWVNAGSAFAIGAENSFGGGIIKVSRGNISGVSGNVSVATIGFRGKAPGSATVAFIGGSAAPRAADSSDSLNLGGSSGGVFKIAQGAAQPAKKPSASVAPETNAAELLISDISVTDISSNSATISWKTNSEADSIVEYGLERDKYFLADSKAELTTEHTVKLENAFLTAGLALHFRISSKDAGGQEVKSADQFLQLKGYQVKIKVVDEENNPVSGVEVLLYSDPIKAVTDKNGEAVFENVSPGSHLAVVKSADEDKVVEVQVSAVNAISNNAEIKVKKAAVKFSLQSIIKFWLVLGVIVPVIVIGFIIVRRRKNQPPSGGVTSPPSNPNTTNIPSPPVSG